MRYLAIIALLAGFVLPSMANAGVSDLKKPPQAVTCRATAKLFTGSDGGALSSSLGRIKIAREANDSCGKTPI